MPSLIEIAAGLVATQVPKTPMTTEQILSEIYKVHAALKGLESGSSIVCKEETKTAITVKEAFKKNEVICMICGKGGFKTLGRHINSAHGITPKAYKKQFGIPSKQVLAAKSYSESRRAMALEIGLADNLVKARKVRIKNINRKKPSVAASVEAVEVMESRIP